MNAGSSRLLPETDVALLEAHAIGAPLEVRAILEELVRSRPPVRLYARDDHRIALVSRVLERDSAAVRLDFTQDAGLGRALLGGGGIQLVAFLDHVKIQFDLRDPRIVLSGGLPTLECPLPARVHRIQRRQAFRVRPPLRSPVECFVRDVAGGERCYRVLDISATGVALLLPGHENVPPVGQLWESCRIEIPGHPPLPCGLLVRAVGECADDAPPPLRVGCELHRPPAEAARRVQFYVMEMQSARAAAR